MSGMCYEKCPQCGGVLIVEEDCLGCFMEEYSWCNSCGKRSSHSVVVDEKGYATRDKDGYVVWKNHESDGYGCLAIRKGDIRTVYHLEKPVDETIKKDYLKALEQEGVVREECYLTTWDNERHELVAVYGNLPETFDETEEKK